MFRKIVEAILNLLVTKGKWIPDKIYISLYYLLRIGKRVRLYKPITYNEKIQWIKLFYKNPLMTICADKIRVRDIVEEAIGESLLTKCYWIGNNPENIPFETLPERFVIKTNHSSGTNIIISNAEQIIKTEIIEKLKYWMSVNFFYSKREWAYKNIPVGIIIEEYLQQDDGDELRDYRFFCFNGKAKYITIDFSITDKKKVRRNVYNTDWELLPYQITYPNEHKITVPKPKKLEEMIYYAEILSAPFPHARIDFYYIKEKIIFGEITFYHQSGMGIINPKEFDIEMGNLITLCEWSEK